MKITLTISLILMSSFLLNAQSIDSLLLSLPFDGNLNDTSTNNFSVAATGFNPDSIYSADRFGVPNKALILNGTSSYATIAHSPLLDEAANGDMTISFWVKYNTTYGVTLNISSEDVYTAYSFHPDVRLSYPPDSFYITFKYSGIGDVNIYDPNPIDTSQWYFVSGSIQAMPDTLIGGNWLKQTKSKLYVNGVYCDSLVSQTFDRPTPHTSVNIGRIPVQGIDNLGNCILDGLVIYDYAMTAAEVDSLYTSSSTSASITRQPMGFSAVQGGTVIFSIEATGQSPSYKWYRSPRYFNDPILSTASTFIKENIQLSDSGNYFCIVYNQFGSVNSDTVRLDIQTSVEIEEPQKSGVTIFPNPTTGKICISSLKNIQTIIIYNSFGAKICEKNVENQQFSFDLSEFGRGVYFISAKNGNDLNISKIVVR